MLNRVSKAILRQQVNSCHTEYWKREKDKKDIPNVEEIEQQAINRIQKMGFSKIRRTSPFWANVILRVYRKEDYEPRNFEGEHWAAYGYRVYTKRYDEWVTGYKEQVIPIDYEPYIVRAWIYQDEYIDCPCHFWDIYLRVSE